MINAMCVNGEEVLALFLLLSLFLVPYTFHKSVVRRFSISTYGIEVDAHG